MTARNADETEISAVERSGGEEGPGYPSQDPSSAFDGREDPHRTGRSSGRGEHRLAVSPRRYRGEPVEKLEIIRLVEQSHIGVCPTLAKLGIPKTTFYRWYDRYLAFGEAGLEDRNSNPGRVWNRIPDDVRNQIVDLALDETDLSPRELAVVFTDTKGHFVSEASVYRLLKAQDLITSPAFIVIKADTEFRDKTTAPKQLWQTDFTSLSRSSAGAGSTRRPSSTIIPAISSPGSFAPP